MSQNMESLIINIATDIANIEYLCAIEKINIPREDIKSCVSCLTTLDKDYKNSLL